MGIKGLMKLIHDYAPKAVIEHDIKNYFGRKIAIDISMSLYQFLIQVRIGPENDSLTNAEGEVTSHIQGIFYRTIRMMENGIKPIYVFDGKPPAMKKGELNKRSDKRDEAEEGMRAAIAEENQEDINKYKKLSVKATRQQNDDCRRLLILMGIPIVDAPSEAEAQCAEMVKSGLVYATGTEDMDTLTFGCDRLVRHLSFAASRKEPIVEINLIKVLEGMQLTMEQFIDVCILCGCDYTTSIPKIGAVTAYKLILKYGNMKEALMNLDERFKVPEDFYPEEAAKLFSEPEVKPSSEISLKWSKPDAEGLVQFLVMEKGFNAERVLNRIKALNKAREKSEQKRIDNFFGAATSSSIVFHKPNEGKNPCSPGVRHCPNSKKDTKNKKSKK